MAQVTCSSWATKMSNCVNCESTGAMNCARCKGIGFLRNSGNISRPCMECNTYGVGNELDSKKYDPGKVRCISCQGTGKYRLNFKSAEMHLFAGNGRCHHCGYAPGIN